VLSTKHHTMKAYWGSGCIAPLILLPRHAVHHCVRNIFTRHLVWLHKKIETELSNDDDRKKKKKKNLVGTFDRMNVTV